MDQTTPESQGQGDRRHRISIGRILVALFIIFASLAFITTVIPAFHFKRNLAKVKLTVERMQMIAEVFENKKASTGSEPMEITIEEVASLVRDSDGIKDGWGQPFQLVSNDQGYVLVSLGSDGLAQRSDPWSYPEGVAASFSDDIVMVNGHFRVRPEALEWLGEN